MVLALALSGAAVRPLPEVDRYAIIVGVNTSPEEGVPPLRFADDDAAKFFELFAAMGARVVLLTVLDPDAQRRFPDAAAAALPPRRAALFDAVQRFFIDMRAHPERRAVFYFIYSGHGGLAPNHEGYLTLLDGRLLRREVYRELLVPSPAAFNHLVLDACQSYFAVQKRAAAPAAGDYREAVQRFLRREELASHPNTGIVLAASSESETHEWSRWGAGLFSHELRSALLGAADADGDGRVTYAEAALTVEAANAAIEQPVARLRVYARPPPARIDEPLVDLREIDTAAHLTFEAGDSGRFHIEDSRGLRVADLHPSGEAAVELRLVGMPPFFVRDQAREAELPASLGRVRLSALAFSTQAGAGKGALEQSFRRHLYALPFGPSFLRGAVATRGPGVQGWDGWYGSAEPPPMVMGRAAEPSHLELGVGLGLAGAAAGAGVAAAILGGMADRSYAAYRDATEPAEARRLKQRTEDQAFAANALWVTASVALLASAGVLTWHYSGNDAGGLALAPNERGAAAVWTERW